jgi:hypothetical protein
MVDAYTYRLYTRFTDKVAKLGSQSDPVFMHYSYKGHGLAGTCDAWDTFIDSSMDIPIKGISFDKITAHFEYQSLSTGSADTTTTRAPATRPAHVSCSIPYARPSPTTMCLN